MRRVSLAQLRRSSARIAFTGITYGEIYKIRYEGGRKDKAKSRREEQEKPKETKDSVGEPRNPRQKGRVGEAEGGMYAYTSTRGHQAERQIVAGDG